MRRIIIADEGSKNPVMYEVGVEGGLILGKSQEQYIKDHMEYYDQVNGAVVCDWHTIITASEFRSPTSGLCITLDDIMNYEA